MRKRTKRAPLKKSHYQTAHVLENVVRNYNSNVSLTKGLNRMFDPSVDSEPSDPELIRSVLDDLFNSGAWLALETYENWDDEGGQCYQAYIVSPEFVQLYHKDRDQVVYPPVDKQQPDLLFTHRHIVEHPEQYWLVWAGPY